jgi:selenide,water dikinase
LQLPNDPNLLVGTSTHDDAGVYRLTDEIALVQTIDFFPPLVDDPYVYGQIAATNALSDVYAMGGTPKTALNLVGYPDNKLEKDWLLKILQGGAERCQASGTVIVGGHTVRDAEIKFGMAVTGIIHPQKIISNANAKPGDKLVLTKPLGSGFITTANKNCACPPELLAEAMKSMVELNAGGRDAMVEIGVNAATDITGFGMAGHAFEMAEGSGTTLVFHLAKLPLFKGVEALVEKKFFTRASKSNRAYVADQLQIEGAPEQTPLECFFDAQTSGGLLISVPAARCEALVAKLKEKGTIVAVVIGEVLPRGAKALVLKA